MFGGNAATDKALQKLVDRKLQRSGGIAGLRAMVANGGVTLTGTLKYENERMPLLKALRGVAGVRNIVDQLKLTPKVRPQGSGHGG